MLELKIFSPQERGFVPEIKWNNEELKAAIIVLKIAGGFLFKRIVGIEIKSRERQIHQVIQELCGEKIRKNGELILL